MPRSHESNEDHAARIEARKAALARAAAALTPSRIVEGPPNVYWPAPGHQSGLLNEGGVDTPRVTPPSLRSLG